MRCPECAYQGPCEGALSCTTTIRNAHNTGERDIIYAWHPWVGRRVEILRVFGRGGVSTVRCRLAGRAQCLPLEVPSWMFERSACASISSVAEPISDTASLCALSQLLAHVEPASNGGCDLGSLIPDSDADLMSCDQKQGDDHALRANKRETIDWLNVPSRMITLTLGVRPFSWQGRF
jgi:hypothetical protein